MLVTQQFCLLNRFFAEFYYDMKVIGGDDKIMYSNQWRCQPSSDVCSIVICSCRLFYYEGDKIGGHDKITPISGDVKITQISGDDKITPIGGDVKTSVIITF